MKTKKNSRASKDVPGESVTPEQRSIATRIAVAVRGRDTSEWAAADGVVEFVGPEASDLNLIELEGLLRREEKLTVTVKDLSKWLLCARIFPPATRVAGASFDIHRAAGIRVRKESRFLNLHRPSDTICEATRKKALPLVEKAVKQNWNRDQTRGVEPKPRSRSKPGAAASGAPTKPTVRVPAAQGGGSAAPADGNEKFEGVTGSEPTTGAATWLPSRVLDMLFGAFARMTTSEEIVELFDAIVEGCEAGLGTTGLTLAEADRNRLADKFAEVVGVVGTTAVTHLVLT